VVKLKDGVSQVRRHHHVRVYFPRFVDRNTHRRT